MRYLFILLLFASTDACAQDDDDGVHKTFAQRHREMMERHERIRDEKDSRPKPYADLVMDGAGFWVTQQGGTTTTNNGALVQMGVDVMLNRFDKKAFLSIGGRLGTSGFRTTVDGRDYSAWGVHGFLVGGVHYMSHPKKPFSFYSALRLMGGFRSAFYGEPINPCLLSQVAVGVRLGRAVTFAATASYTMIDAYAKDRYYYHQVYPYTAYLIGASVHITLRDYDND
ncbi:MAG: hypothetical protein JST82_01365 [Bacteroidetes bacterium]|nr:hypothetical protein [Bacteroidota bacterium]